MPKIEKVATKDLKKEDFEAILLGNFEGAKETEQNDSVKELEVAKVVLGTMMNPTHLNSTTNLREEEIEEIANALMVDEILDCPMINAFIKPYLELKRSQTDTPRNMLTIMSDIVGKALPKEEPTGLARLLGNRFT